MSKIASQAEKLLTGFASSNVDDLYFAKLLSEQKAVKSGKDLEKTLSDSIKNTVTKNFNKTNWAYAESGFSTQSIRAAHLLSSAKDADYSNAV